MQKQSVSPWVKCLCVLELILGLGCGFSPDARAQVAVTNDAASAGPLGTTTRLTLKEEPASIWEGDVGEGFRKRTQQVGFALGTGLGVRRSVVGASTEAHDLALASVHYGRVLTGVMGPEHWYGGNLEWLAEGFGGAQYSPRTAYLAGGAAFLRYDFRTGTRLVPFFDIGGGCVATDIKQPDLSTVFQFNEQGGPGAHYFWRDNAAITVEFRYMHISNASIKSPNQGANSALVYAGMSWFF
jgi:lipid A 3-O-deacylase